MLLIAPIFIFIFAPGFYFDDFKKDLAVDILRIMFPYLALISLVAFSSGIQNSHDRFSLPAFTPLIFNISLIIAAVYLAPKFSIPVFALAWGVLAAGFMQLVIHIIALKKINRLPRPTINWSHPGLKKFITRLYFSNPCWWELFRLIYLLILCLHLCFRQVAQLGCMFLID